MKQFHPAEPSLQMRRMLSLAARCALGAVLAGGQLFGEYAPLGLALTASSGGGSAALCALLGALVGALAFMDFSHGLRYVAVNLLLFSAANAFFDTKFYRKRYFMPLLSVGLALCVEIVYLVSADISQSAYFLLSLFLLGIGVYYFRPLFTPLEGDRKSSTACFIVLCGVLMAAQRFLVARVFSPGRMAAALCVLLLSGEPGANTGFFCAVALGLALDLCQTPLVFLHSTIFGVGAFFVGLRPQGKRTANALRFIVPITVLLLPFSGEAGLCALYESVAATLVYLLLPARVLRSGKRLRAPTAEQQRAEIRSQLEQAADAFRELYNAILPSRETTAENPAVIFDSAAEQVCRGCSLCAYCWEKEYVSTYNALNDATSALLRRGRSSAGDFPTYFADRCIHFSAFRAAVDHYVSIYLLRRQYARQLQESRRSAKGQYARISDLLCAAAGRLKGGVQPVSGQSAMPYQVGMALRPRAAERVSGDSATFFEADGVLYLLLSDGMGTGSDARRESALAVRLLERFLRSGIEPLPALKTLNAALTLHGEDTGSFTTIDLCVLPLSGGECTAYKYGAAPSYHKHLGSVQRITCSCLPAGLDSDGCAPEETLFTLAPGSFLVMVTDGIADEEDDEWLQDLLCGWEGDNAQTLVNVILAESKKHRAADDDCGVLAVYIPAAENGAREV